MKKTLIVVVCVLMSALMVFGTLATVLQVAPTAASGNEMENVAATTVTPSFFFDFGRPDFDAKYYYHVGNTGLDSAAQTYMTQTSYNPNGYRTLTATNAFQAGTLDPQVTLFVNGSKGVAGNTMRYMVIYYNTSCSQSEGQFYYSTPSAGYGETQKYTFNWTNDGQWHTTIYDTATSTGWGNKADTVKKLRFDFLNGSISNGASVSVGYIAFFDTYAKAQSFDVTAYRQVVQDEEDAASAPTWTQPPAQTVDTSANAPGSLKYNYSADRSTVTISYTAGGKTYSTTVPNKAQYLSGPFQATDDLGRALYDQTSTTTLFDGYQNYTVGVKGSHGEHYVGIFYFLWLGQHGDQGVFNITNILANGGSAANNASYSGWGPIGSMHFFAEPLYGYYFSGDDWVIRKHMELLANAGVDFLYFDTTNGYPYTENALKVMRVCSELNTQGFDAPEVMFYTNTDLPGQATTVQKIYDGVYSPGLYEDTWFRINGKPAIVATSTSNNPNNFFTIKKTQWPNQSVNTSAWPWIDFKWEQTLYTDTMSVSVSQHASGCFSDSIFGSNTTNRGRSYYGYYSGGTYTGSHSKKTSTSYIYGYNFQSQFDRALMVSPKYVLVTGWNEWVAQRQNGATFGRPSTMPVFIDTGTLEYSRDIEMTRGAYFDNYYIQLVRNVQAMKGAAPTVVQDGITTINVTGDFNQWNQVPVTYKDPSGDTADRNCEGFGTNVYTNTTGRNDIVYAKVASDDNYVYFFIEAAKPIQKYNNASTWMNIYVDTDDNSSTGWYGYDYIINSSQVNDYTTRIAKANANGKTYSFTETSTATMKVNLRKMMVAVPLSALGITDPDAIIMNFKIADSDTKITTMEQFYTDGDVAPLGRLNYVYQNCFSKATAAKRSSVTYDANGGSGAPTAQIKTYGYILTLSSTAPVRDGYVFKGWATSPTATTANYQPGAQYGVDQDLKLYAVWGGNSYTVSYNANGGTGAPAAQEKTPGVSMTLSTTVPTKAGSTFLGWATSPSATTAQYAAGATYTTDANVTLYAVWSTYTLGDVTGDGVVNTKDLTRMKKFLASAGDGSVSLTPWEAGDVNVDGKVNAKDLSRLNKYLAAPNDGSVELG